jgi:hypothetical protein
LASFVIGNPLIINNRREKNPISNNLFLYDNIQADKKKIAKVTVDKFFDDEGDFVTIQMTSEILGLPVTENQYADIRTAIIDTMFIIKNKQVSTTVPINLTLTKFLSRFKKGSKKFRNILSLHRNHKLKCMKKKLDDDVFQEYQCTGTG